MLSSLLITEENTETQWLGWCSPQRCLPRTCGYDTVLRMGGGTDIMMRLSQMIQVPSHPMTGTIRWQQTDRKAGKAMRRNRLANSAHKSKNNEDSRSYQKLGEKYQQIPCRHGRSQSHSELGLQTNPTVARISLLCQVCSDLLCCQEH